MIHLVYKVWTISEKLVKLIICCTKRWWSWY